jgi:hypothetical protein
MKCYLIEDTAMTPDFYLQVICYFLVLFNALQATHLLIVLETITPQINASYSPTTEYKLLVGRTLLLLCSQDPEGTYENTVSIVS